MAKRKFYLSTYNKVHTSQTCAGKYCRQIELDTDNCKNIRFCKKCAKKYYKKQIELINKQELLKNNTVTKHKDERYDNRLSL